MAFAKVVKTEGAPTLAEAAALAGVALELVNGDFGVVLVDPEHSVYVIDIKSEEIPPAPREHDAPPLYSNPKIETL
jgi:hypothetical protein